jgi:hypothetical protein
MAMLSKKKRKLLLRSPKKRKPDGLNHDGIEKSGKSSKEGYGSKRAALPMEMIYLSLLICP